MTETMLMRRPNKVRAKLAEGRCVLGTAIYSSSPAMVSAAGYSGIDFVRIDTEHGWRRDESLENMIRAAIIADVVSIVRIDRDDPYLVRKALEIGAGGVLIPNVISVADARAVVSAAKFPPLGERGIGPLCQSGEWGLRSRDEWVRWSNTEPLVGVMIESVAAMPVIDEILAVDGVDFAVFGPSDYYMSLPEGDEDEKKAMIREGLVRTIAAAKRSGKHVLCGVGLDGDDAQVHKDLGVTMLCFSHDVVMIRKALEKKVAQFPG
jgi:2-keto-3-deoxy-L-rhamnonate aldolase RhmA